jgi:hypothetical protein
MQGVGLDQAKRESKQCLGKPCHDTKQPKENNLEEQVWAITSAVKTYKTWKIKIEYI